MNDDPFAPISKFARERLAECGEATPIGWLRRDQRYVEKLATPDVTIADIIGDVDPIKAARGGHLLSDELTMHFGLLPRANRGIFAINELPDLSGKVQVGLFNILQARGIPSRFLNFPNENHWVLKQENSLVWHTEIFNWINHYAKGEPLSDTPIGN